MTLRTLLQHRLKRRGRSPNYLQWIYDNKDRSKHGHHIVRKNDYLVAKLTPEHHLYRENEDYDLQLVDAIDNLIDYVIDLELELEEIKERIGDI